MNAQMSSLLNYLQSHQKVSRVCRSLLGSWLVAGLFSYAAPLLAEQPPVRVLLIQSFAQGQPLAEIFNQQLAQTLRESPRMIELSMESMDIRRFNDEAAKYALARYISRKYAQKPPDFILAMDDPSTMFVIQNSAQLFPRVPLLHAGLKELGEQKGRKTYRLRDEPDYLANLQLIEELLPEVQTLVILGRVKTAEGESKLGQAIANARQRFAEVQDLSGASEEQLQALLPKLPANSAVLVAGYVRDEQGRLPSPVDTARKIVAASPAPVFIVLDVGSAAGVVGGKMVSPEARAKAFAALLQQLLDAQADAPLELSQQDHQRHIFDYQALQRFGLEDRSLPEGSVVRNVPRSVFETNPRSAFAGLFVAFVLLLVVAYLLYRFYVRHSAGLRLLRRAEEYRVLFEENPAPMLVYEPKSYEVMAINQAFARVYGFEAAEIVGRPFIDLIGEAQRQAMIDAVSRLQVEQVAASSSRWSALTREGERRSVEITSQAINFGGRPSRAVRMTDITERLVTEEKIRQREQFLHQIIESSPLPTFVLDAEQRVTDWNFALELLSRLPAKTMIGKRHNLGALLGTPDGGATLAESMLQGLNPDDPLGTGRKRGVFPSAYLAEGIELEIYNSQLDRWTHSIAVPLRKPDGTLLGAIQSAMDVTELRVTQAELQRVNAELEQRVQLRTDELTAASEELQRAMQQLVQSEKLAALGGLVAGVAHELNTPIGNAMTVVTTLNDHLERFRAEVESNALRRNQITSFIELCDEACVMLERNTQRAAELVASFKQIAVDQTSMRRRQFSLLEAVEETLITVAPGYKHQPVTVTHSIPPGLEFDSYPGALERAISTLVENAVVHALGQREHLGIAIHARPVKLKRAPAVSISVQDDGIGMSSEVARRVFDPFFTTQLGRGGSGLGLYVVFSLVTSVLGGKISLRTLPEQGSCFTLVVPLKAPAPVLSDEPSQA